jgi:hypothetical protein
MLSVRNKKDILRMGALIDGASESHGLSMPPAPVSKRVVGNSSARRITHRLEHVAMLRLDGLTQQRIVMRYGVFHHVGYCAHNGELPVMSVKKIT